MATREQQLAFLQKHSTPDTWREQAEWRRANRSWLRHSQRIAVIMLDAMKEQHITQSQLAERMGCSQQYVSKVLKGNENLSLETMTKIEDALTLSLLPVFA